MPSVRPQRAASGFNMIEIVLALAVIAVGVISILGLFPVGMAASRDAMAIDYAANAADQFLHQFEYLIRLPATTTRPTGWEIYVLGAIDRTGGLTWDASWNKFEIPDNSTMNITSERADFEVPADGDLLETVAGGSGTTGNEAVFRYAPGGSFSTATRRYKVIRYLERSSPRDNEYDVGEDILDFDAIMVIYRGSVVIPTVAAPLPPAMATSLNVDISWPAQLPEERREKRTYRLELFRR